MTDSAALELIGMEKATYRIDAGGASEIGRAP